MADSNNLWTRAARSSRMASGGSSNWIACASATVKKPRPSPPEPTMPCVSPTTV